MCVTLCVCMWRDDSYMQFSMSSAKWNGILDFWVLFLQITQYACVQKDTPVPVYACACMQKPTMWPRRDRVVLVCPEQYVTPVTKIDQNIQKTRARHAHAKCSVLDYAVSRPNKICTTMPRLSSSDNSRDVDVTRKTCRTMRTEYTHEASSHAAARV